MLNSDTENTSPDKLLEKKNEINNISQAPLKLISIKSNSDKDSNSEKENGEL
jgi:hypothetical protein